MPPATRSVERGEERRLNTRTLTIASVASATAAAVTSQLWIAGTWIAAALTPVLVALISEAMHRPTERIARAWTAAGEARSSTAISPTRREPTAVTGTPGPVRVYRAGGGSGSRSTMLTRRRIALGTVAATAAIACVIGLVALTTVDLVSGGSVGKGSGRFTLAGGSGSRSNSDEQDQQKDSSSQPSGQRESTGRQNDTPRDTTTTPSTPAPTEQLPSDTAPAPPTTETPPGEPVPQPQSP
jgi:hypothetical protein